MVAWSFPGGTPEERPTEQAAPHELYLYPVEGDLPEPQPTTSEIVALAQVEI